MLFRPRPTKRHTLARSEVVEFFLTHAVSYQKKNIFKYFFKNKMSEKTFSTMDRNMLDFGPKHGNPDKRQWTGNLSFRFFYYVSL